MALKKFTENGVTYFEVYMCCPVCNSRGVFTNQSYWLHHRCGGILHLGENAYYKCTRCGGFSHVKGWRYSCPTHSGDQQEFIGVTAAEFAATIAVAGQLTNQAGIAWLQEFLRNLGEGW